MKPCRYFYGRLLCELGRLLNQLPGCSLRGLLDIDLNDYVLMMAKINFS